jgi:hypothetical protein
LSQPVVAGLYGATMFFQLPAERPIQFKRISNIFRAPGEYELVWCIEVVANAEGAIPDFRRTFISNWNYTKEQLIELLAIAKEQHEPNDLMAWIQDAINNPKPMKFVVEDFRDNKVWMWEYPVSLKVKRLSDNDYNPTPALVKNHLTRYEYNKNQLEQFRERAIAQTEPASLIAWLDNEIAQAREEVIPRLD